MAPLGALFCLNKSRAPWKSGGQAKGKQAPQELPEREKRERESTGSAGSHTIFYLIGARELEKRREKERRVGVARHEARTTTKAQARIAF